MRQFIESIRRLYQSGKLDKDKVVELWKNNKITEEEMEYIFNI